MLMKEGLQYKDEILRDGRRSLRVLINRIPALIIPSAHKYSRIKDIDQRVCLLALDVILGLGVSSHHERCWEDLWADSLLFPTPPPRRVLDFWLILSYPVCLFFFLASDGPIRNDLPVRLVQLATCSDSYHEPLRLDHIRQERDDHQYIVPVKEFSCDKERTQGAPPERPLRCSVLLYK